MFGRKVKLLNIYDLNRKRFSQYLFYNVNMLFYYDYEYFTIDKVVNEHSYIKYFWPGNKERIYYISG